ALGIGLLMDSVEAGHSLLQVRGNGFIGSQHELLDQPVRPVSLRGSNALHQPKVIELDHRLRQVEIDGPALDPFAVENLRQLVHQIEIARQRGKLAACRPVTLDDGIDVRVGHALRRADYPFPQVISHHLALGVDLHHAGEHQAVDLGAEAADVGREFKRKHGYGTVGEIDRGPATAGLVVDGRSVFYVVGHVGNVDVEFVASVGQPVDQDSVVEVTGGFAVDGHYWQTAVVVTATEFLGRNLR